MSNSENSNAAKFFLHINESERPIVHEVKKVDGHTYIRVSLDRFIAYCKSFGFTYSNAINQDIPIQILNEVTGNKRDFKLLKEAPIVDIWRCEEDENMFLIASKILDAKGNELPVNR